jgi:D-alanine-D-alanine ligase
MQEYINGVEYTCACSDYSGIVTTLPLVKIINSNTIFDYKTKYIDNTPHYEIVENSTDLENRIQKITKYIYHEIDARHTIRVDFIVKKEKIYVLEINTLPRLSEKSSLSLMLAKENISVDKYIEKLIKK